MSEIDPDLGTAWRAASREQPPAALDDSIRAAARREVGAKPGRLRAAPRWWPLAAAATVAAVAVGIVQMTPPEQVTPAAFSPATNAARQQVTADAMKPADTTLKRDAAAASAVATDESQRNALREEAKPAAKEQLRRAGDETKPRASNSADRFAAPPGASVQDKKTTLQAPAQPAKDTTERDQAAKQKAELAASLAVAHQNTSVPSPPAAPAPRDGVQPFAPPPVPADGGASNAPPPMIAAMPPPPAPEAAAAPAPARSRISASTMSATKPAAQSSPSSAMAESAGKAEPEAPRDAAALGKVASTGADKAAQERRKDAAPLAPDEWIKRIRRLIADGKNEDAAKELAAFRREYKERAETLLPSDLRTFRP